MSVDRPLLGLTCGTISGQPARFGTNQKYVAALQQAGAEVVLLPPGASTGVLERLDGLVLPGGPDIDPARYGQPVAGSEEPFDPARDELELSLVGAAWSRLRVLAICRGMQVANVARGGSLVQHLEGHRQAGDRTAVSHEMSVDAASRLGSAVGGPSAGVNSLHHQVIDRLGDGLQVTARHRDIIEGMESADGLLVGVQCHPEELTRLEWPRRLFADFVVACGGIRAPAGRS